MARRLDKFTFEDISLVLELEDSEIEHFLAELVSEQIIVKNGIKYFFNIKKPTKQNKKGEVSPIKDIHPIIIEKEDGYDYFLTLNNETKERIRKYVELLNFINKTSLTIKQGVELFNQNSGYKKISLCTFSRVRNKFKQYGFKGILPIYSTDHIESAIPKDLYSCFKKYYLTNEKLSASEAIYRAQKQLQAEQKIEQPFAYPSGTFLRKLKSEFKREQIEYLRNNISPAKEKIEIKKEIKEPLDMFFKDAAKIYFNRLKAENKLERIMHQKTDYKNHLKEYFGNMRIRDIKNKVVAKFKQKKFDSGYQLVSVNNYILTLKNIINEVCPKTNYLMSRNKKINENTYAMDMNILSDEQITKLLDICNNKYPKEYPILYIALSTGASIPELLGLTWDRIDFEAQTISLKYFLYGNKLIMNKCNSTMRCLKIESKICDILKDKYYKISPNPTDFVFEFDKNKTAQQYIEEDILIPLSKQLGVSQLYPSDMQHNFVNMCIKQNIPLTFIQKSLGYYGIVNFIKTYRNLIEKLEDGNYNPLNEILENKE